METKLFSPDCLPETVPSLRQKLSQGSRSEIVVAPTSHTVRVPCVKCEGTGYEDDPLKVYVDPPTCMACRGKRYIEVERTSVPIVTINASDFVATCEQGADGVTALDILDHLLKRLRASKVQSCWPCNGKGTTADPFDEGAAPETCLSCEGQGKTTFVGLPGDCIGDIKLLINFAADLRAAVDYAKGGQE
jgi:DnaJ-class molecular chaperone